MKKIGMSEGKTIVLLSDVEFTGLTGNPTGDYSDGSTISLSGLKAKLDLVDNNKPKLTGLKTQCQDVIDQITSVGL